MNRRDPDLDSPTTFPWHRLRRGSSWRLAGIILAMLFCHSLAFFLFQTIPPAIRPPPRSAPAVQLLTPLGNDGNLSPENQSLLRWIEAEDPVLVALVPNATLPAALQDPVQYKPSFSIPRTPPLGPPPEQSTVLFPPARDAASLIRPPPSLKEEPSPQITPRTTTIRFSQNIKGRLVGNLNFAPTAKTERAPEPTRYLIAVNQAGETQFAFAQPQETAVVRALNEEALAFLLRTQFKPAAGPPTEWAFATIHWGDEITAR